MQQQQRSPYPKEVRDRALSLFQELQKNSRSRWEAVVLTAAESGISRETLWNWIKKMEGIDTHSRVKRSAQLEQENQELRWTNKVLRDTLHEMIRGLHGLHSL